MLFLKYESLEKISSKMEGQTGLRDIFLDTCFSIYKISRKYSEFKILTPLF